MTLLFSLAVDGAILFALLALIALFIRYESVVLFAVLGVCFVDAVFMGIPALEFGGFNLYPQDLISPVLLAAGLIRLGFRRPTKIHMVWGLFALAAGLSLYSGYQLYGSKASVNEFRQFFFFISATTYFSSLHLTPSLVQRLKRAWYITAGFLIALAIYRWAAWAFGLPVMDSWSAAQTASYGRITRALPASNALFLLQGWLLMGPSIVRTRAKRTSRFFAFLLIAFVVALQHRTVWIAAIACIIFLYARLRALLRRPLWLVSAAAVTLIAVVAAISLGSSNPIVSSLRFSVTEATDTEHSTLEWRVSSWQKLINGSSAPDTLNDAILGSHPFGSGLRRRVEGAVVNVSAHSLYVDTFLRTGLLGLAPLICCFSMIIWKLWRSRLEGSSQLQQVRRIVGSVLLSQLVYSLGYALGYEQGILLGFAMSVAAMKGPEPLRDRSFLLAGKFGARLHLAARYRIPRHPLGDAIQ